MMLYNQLKDTTKKERQNSFNLKRILVFLFVIMVGIVNIFPIYWMLLSAFKTPAEVIQWPPTFFPKVFTVVAFKEVLTHFTIDRWFLNSVFISTSVTLIVLFVASLAAFSFAYHRFPGQKILFLYILSSLMVPMHIRMIPSFILIKQLGWLESYQGLIIPQAAALCGLGIFLLRQFYVGIPKDLIDAARIDGCKEFQIYIYIGLPILKPALIALGIFVFIRSWNNFIWPLLVVQKECMKTLPLGLVAMSEGKGQEVTSLTWPQRMAGATLVTLPILLLYTLFRNLFIKGITLTGLKG